jgi:putative acetyltransferase
MQIEITNETAADVAAIRAVTISAFLHAEHTSHTEQLIIDALRLAEQLTVSLVAKVDGAVVGHIAISPVSLSDGATGWYGLGPLSVAPDYQRRGIAR